MDAESVSLPPLFLSSPKVVLSGFTGEGQCCAGGHLASPARLPSLPSLQTLACAAAPYKFVTYVSGRPVYFYKQ